jgi:hypothetical protein
MASRTRCPTCRQRIGWGDYVTSKDHETMMAMMMGTKQRNVSCCMNKCVYIIKVHAYTEDNFEHCLYQKETGLLLGDYLKELITMMMMVVMSKSPRTFVVYLYLTLGSDTTWSFSYTTSKLYA